MTKQELLDELVDVPNDATLEVCIAEGAEIEEIEEGSLLTIDQVGFVARTHVLYVNTK